MNFTKEPTCQDCNSDSKSVSTQSCPALCDRMDCSPPGSSVHGILQARALGWVAIPFSGGSSRPEIEPGSPTLQTIFQKVCFIRNRVMATMWDMVILSPDEKISEDKDLGKDMCICSSD